MKNRNEPVARFGPRGKPYRVARFGPRGKACRVARFGPATF